MTKKEICLHFNSIAAWNLYGYYSLEVHHIRDGYIYCCYTNGNTYHKLKVHMESNRPYVLFNHRRLHLDECERVPI